MSRLHNIHFTSLLGSNSSVDKKKVACTSGNFPGTVCFMRELVVFALSPRRRKSRYNTFPFARSNVDFEGKFVGEKGINYTRDCASFNSGRQRASGRAYWRAEQTLNRGYFWKERVLFLFLSFSTYVPSFASRMRALGTPRRVPAQKRDRCGKIIRDTFPKHEINFNPRWTDLFI